MKTRHLQSKMHTLNVRCRAVLPGIALLVLSAVGLKADVYAYAGLGSGEFGTLDLNTGAFNPLSNLGVTPAGLGVAGGTLYAASYGNGTLYRVNPANGSFTQVGIPSDVFYSGGFGSTTSGLYGLAGTELYSINPLTGAATAIGSDGINLQGWRDLSVNSGTLYFGNGADLYTINTTTGAGTLVGAFGGGAEIGALVMEGGVLYGGDQGNLSIDTINTSTGAATIISGNSVVSDVWGLAPDPVTAATPEPGSKSYAALMLILGGIIVVVRSRSVRQRE